MTPDVFATLFHETRCSAILRTDRAETAKPAMEAAIRAGFRVIEFTLTIPGALGLIEQFADRSDVVVGAGTVLTVDEMKAAVDAGARCIVSPVTDPLVIEAARTMNVAVMPGAHTPSEMMLAHRLGATLIKLFPAPDTGPAWVKSILAPMPFLKIVPTNGVHLNNAAAYLKAGAFAVGFTTALFDANDLAQSDFASIETRGRALLAAVTG